MFEIIFLGTSASAPSAKRNLPALVVKHDEYRFLVDCGEGTQRQILQSGIGFKRLNDILITHGHLDHILGLAGLLSTFMRWETIDELRIHGGRSALDRISDLLYGVWCCARRSGAHAHPDDCAGPGGLLGGGGFHRLGVPLFPHRQGRTAWGSCS